MQISLSNPFHSKFARRTRTRFDAGDLCLDENGNVFLEITIECNFQVFLHIVALLTRSPRAHHTNHLESKFFVQSGLRASGWVNIRGGRKRGVYRSSFCTHEYECCMSDVVYDQRDDVTPMVVCSIDIESVPNTGFQCKIRRCHLLHQRSVVGDRR